MIRRLILAALVVFSCGCQTARNRPEPPPDHQKEPRSPNNLKDWVDRKLFDN